MKTRDIDIRIELKRKFAIQYPPSSDTLIIEEMGLCQGISRVDIAVINGEINGYEIKSESDTLERLPGQVEIYSQVLDNVTLVAGKNHLNKIYDIIPKWWSVLIAEYQQDKVKIYKEREGYSNPSVNPFSLAQLLWREEALEILNRFDIAKGLQSKPRRILWEKLAQYFSVPELKSLVRDKIKSRTSWRAAL